MQHELEDFRTVWHAQPTTFFHLTPQAMRGAVERIDRRQRRIDRGIVMAFAGDVVGFTLVLLFVVTNVLEAAGCLWIMLAMGWFARRLWMQVRNGAHAYDEVVARPSIHAFRASLEVRLEFYRSPLAFGAVLPGVVIVAGIANGFRVHLPKARAIRRQLLVLDRL